MRRDYWQRVIFACDSLIATRKTPGTEPRQIFALPKAGRRTLGGYTPSLDREPVGFPKMSTTRLSPDALDTLFREARTHNAWRDGEVSDADIHAIYDLLKFGPTSANCCPARLVWVRSPAAKEKLKPFLDESNVAKTLAAPVTVIVAHDLEFYDKLPELFPHDQSARSWFAGKPEKIEATAFRNSTLQGGYLLLAARALGFDCGPMSGFDNARLDAAYFAGTPWRSNFLVNLGHGDDSKLFPRSPRLSFEQANRIE